jgi:AcrR family transcriptional regulator
MSRRESGPRPYLRAGARRSQLLDAATALIGRQGLGSVTVAAVALEAGVSRQWVYEHFSDLDDLYRALILDRFSTLDANIDAAKTQSTGTELATFAAREVFALAPADRRILRALVVGAGWNRPELAEIETVLRERIIGRWTGYVRQAGHDEPNARAIVWAVVNAVFALADQIERECLAVDQAAGLLALLLAGLVPPRPGDHRPRRPPVGADTMHRHRTETSHAH